MLRQGIQLHPMLPVNVFRRGLCCAWTCVTTASSPSSTDASPTPDRNNIVNANYGHKDMVWHDVTVPRQPIALQLQGIFIEDWHFETGDTLDLPELFPQPEIGGIYMAQSLPSGPTYPSESYHRLVVSAILRRAAAGHHHLALHGA